MNRHFIIDTNVIIAGSDPERPKIIADQISPEDRLVVMDWLKDFHSNPNSFLVLDQEWKIHDEYLNQNRMNDYGMRVIQDKMKHGKLIFHSLSWDQDGFAVVPKDFDVFDNSDKKFVALCLVEKKEKKDVFVVNDCDSDWGEHHALMKQYGIVVFEILPHIVRKKRP